MSNQGKRPSTGVVTIEWVDASDADKGPNPGWTLRTEPPLDDERLLQLLRGVGQMIEDSHE